MVVVDGGVLARENGFPGLRSVGGHVTKKAFCLSGSLYKKSLLNKIGMIGNVTNIDYNIDNGTQGWFARIVVCVDLNDVEEVAKVPIKEPSMEYKVAMKDYGSWMVV
ncbi:hypothetical protein Gotri_000884 [Gossypium trilobum]|uniref:Uncharacterized protein n=1 Tax=Gossypium trilobum TaxID=34281 RepID=A0A7J9FCT7_9ROSI|nr:hypothetical protein [Gossypium trilobum]